MALSSSKYKRSGFSLNLSEIPEKRKKTKSNKKNKKNSESKKAEKEDVILEDINSGDETGVEEHKQVFIHASNMFLFVEIEFL